LPKAAPGSNNSKNPLGDHDNIFTINNNHEDDWDPSGYIQSIGVPKPKAYHLHSSQKFVAYGRAMRKMHMKLKKGFNLMKRAMKTSRVNMRRKLSYRRA